MCQSGILAWTTISATRRRVEKDGATKGERGNTKLHTMLLGKYVGANDLMQSGLICTVKRSLNRLVAKNTFG